MSGKTLLGTKNSESSKFINLCQKYSKLLLFKTLTAQVITTPSGVKETRHHSKNNFNSFFFLYIEFLFYWAVGHHHHKYVVGANGGTEIEGSNEANDGAEIEGSNGANGSAEIGGSNGANGGQTETTVTAQSC